jgi:adenylate cyclase
MGIEIERKFLVAGHGWRELVSGRIDIEQGYLARDKGVTLRIRILDGKDARLTIKAGGSGISRGEFEYDVPIEDGRDLMALCGDAVIKKVRHLVKVGDDTWEVDVFGGLHSGLVLAELELDHEEQHVTLPDWVGEEVSTDPRYYNSTLAGF